MIDDRANSYRPDESSTTIGGLHDESSLFARQSLRDNKAFSNEDSLRSALPSLEIVNDNSAVNVTARWDNTRGLVKEDHTFDWAKQNIRRDVVHGGEPPPLGAWQQRIARGIEHNILNGDLRNLQTMLHRYSGQGEELVPILREVRKDLQRRGLLLNFSYDEKSHQCQFHLGHSNRFELLTLSTDRRQPAKGTRIRIEDDHGRLVSTPEAKDPMKVMKRIAS